MPSSVKWRAKRAPSPLSAAFVKSLSSLANSSRVMPPPFVVGATLAHLRIWKAGPRKADILPRGLFGGLRRDRARHARKPAVDKRLQPGALGNIVHRTIGKMLVTRTGARRIHAVIAARGPAMHHRVGDIGVEL